MSFIHREKLIQEAETCRETTDAFVSLIQSQPNVAIHINLNDTVKFRLTDYGKDIFYHRFDEVNTKIRKRGGKLIEPNMPKVDSDGYTRMQLWQFMELFGPHTGMAMKTTLSLLKSFMEVEPMISPSVEKHLTGTRGYSIKSWPQSTSFSWNGNGRMTTPITLSTSSKRCWCN